MDLQSILKDGVEAGGIIFTPAIIPVDYGGTFVCNVSLHLSDGSCIMHSSLELGKSNGSGESSLAEETVALLQKDVTASGLRPRCDYLDASRTKAYRALAGIAQPELLASACLCGERCRYDGGGACLEAIGAMLEDGRALPVCPEVSGRLPVPRPPCEISQGKVVDCRGNDHSAAFAAGARRTLAAARTFGIKNAILKERSPSCGCSKIYDGSFSGTLIDGQGVCTALLRDSGIAVKSEEAYK